MKLEITRQRTAWATLLLSLLPLTTFAQSENQISPKTQVVMLGTGTPGWDPDRSGPATAILVNGTPYLVDFGAGVVRRAASAHRKGVQGLLPSSLNVVFLTHMHADHTVGYPDLIFQTAQSAHGRKQPLEVYGPKGLIDMTTYVLKAFSNVPDDPRFKVAAHEIEPGIVYKDANVTVKAFLVVHRDIQAFGYRFETADRTIVVSGDTAPTQSIVDNCRGCDVLIHEAYSMLSYNCVTPAFQERRKKLHTSSLELAAIATEAKPGLLVLYHRSNPGLDAAGKPCPNPEEAVLQEIQQIYKGKVVTGHDLDVL